MQPPKVHQKEFKISQPLTKLIQREKRQSNLENVVSLDVAEDESLSSK